MMAHTYLLDKTKSPAPPINIWPISWGSGRQLFGLYHVILGITVPINAAGSVPFDLIIRARFIPRHRCGARGQGPKPGGALTEDGDSFLSLPSPHPVPPGPPCVAYLAGVERYPGAPPHVAYLAGVERCPGPPCVSYLAGVERYPGPPPMCCLPGWGRKVLRGPHVFPNWLG
uniref:Uncharacterized protein n=1 Tax=Xenopus tropicalis TaxID=8364 RepID=A0A1B8XT50_XENTR